jgi:tRNA(Ile)-lysidine synthase
MLEQLFIANVDGRQLFSRRDRLFIAVSGGVDSVVLCHLCFKAGFSFELVHVNFKLRGEDSEADETFVRNLGIKYSVQVQVKSVDTLKYAQDNHLSIQVAARRLRYGWFDELLLRSNGFLLTAHHADDNVETVMMHFFRGTGISGLRGIPEKSGRYVRPLLWFTKDDLIAYAKENALSWREDSSNETDKYTRNFFRNKVIPLVAKVFPEASKNISHNIEIFTEAEQLYLQAVEFHKKKLLEKRGEETHIPVLKLKKTQPLRSVLFEICKEYNFTAGQLPDLVHLLDAEHGKTIYSGTHRILKNRNWLIISPRAASGAGYTVIEAGEESAMYDDSMLLISLDERSKIKLNNPPNRASMDLDSVEYPLILRPWKMGDYFYPLGMNKKKKISRFLIDQKLSKTQKEKVWVLESGKRICWVVGMRLDERFKVKENTRAVLIVQQQPKQQV